MAALEAENNRPIRISRRKSSAPAAVQSDQLFQYQTDAARNLVADVASSSNAEHTTFSSRCSVRILHDIISNFSPQKVDLVRSIGFEGVLHIPLLKHINLRFSAWLMTRVDELANSLVLTDGTCLEFNKHDVARVFGIPSGGSSIFLNPPNTHFGCSVSSQFVNPTGPAYFRSIKAAQEIVSRQFEGNMSSIEQHEFKAAFVVLVMSNLLALSAKHDRVSDDFIHAIQNPAKIASYDWAEYVLCRLLDAVAKLKIDIGNNVKAPYIYGCSLFLQVLYLDSIDLGSLSIPHDQFLRIRCFTSDRFRAMIAADPSFNLNGFNMDGVCKPQLRDPTIVCYHWARSPTKERVITAPESRLLSLWQFLLSITRVLKMSPEAAGPLFIAASGCPEALKFMDVLLHLIEPYMNGFSYRPSISLKSRPFDLCRSRNPDGCKGAYCCAHLLAARPKRKFSPANDDVLLSGNTHVSPTQRHHWPARGRHFGAGLGSCMLAGLGYLFSSVADNPSVCDISTEEVDIQAISAMARFYIQLTPVKPTRCSDLNSSPNHDQPDCIVPFHGRIPCDQPRTPWQLGGEWNFDIRRSRDIMKKLSIVDYIDDPWISHFCPKYIEVTTRAVKEQFLGHSELELELVDAAIRRFKQIDDELYAQEGNLRWRHYVESDFMVGLLAGYFNICDPVQRSHFCGRHIKYDVTSCRMFFFPVILQYRWACFVWSIEDNTIVVYDPCCNLTPQHDPMNCYASVAKLLKSAMSVVSSLLFDGWTHDWLDARLEVYDTASSSCPSWNRSGLMCLHFCQCFDGSKTTPPLDMEQIDVLTGTILGDVSVLLDNFGVVPNSIRQLLLMEKQLQA